ncbi:hypothetical protein E1A91_A01G079000v1 [Gossypium mustelinum]|uniref:COBRA C-terminal domain-containing protein n=3 Tax=Gossypium TaxID=3633 RepID=A0A2P5XVP6_GOSBA|nr:hypothetical protein ES319_A01G076900v1 [Gossypium barbadense]PPS07417.1 hypothetical protein GOBAR_AA13226 [Gossypium barbadense]TYH30306.1 hypothetical protein ES288_A01G084400v1 [Gossypium darwinii]TYJ48665.1 hypothetical protein E1A91_A01G079000v1 [Gossypium mustelinum]
MKVPGLKLICLAFLFIHTRILVCYGALDDAVDDYTDETPAKPPPPEMDNCNGVFLSYAFTSRTKALPLLKNVSAQPWTFNAMATVVNSGTEEVKGWKMYIGFQHKEILVSATNAVLIDGGGDFPTAVGNGTTLAGYPKADLKTSIDTAGDFNQIAVQVELKGSMFGLGEKATPMPKTISLKNDGWRCPTPTKYKTYMHACCKRDLKFKVNSNKKSKFAARQNGDLTFMYDVVKSYEGSYEAQVTMDNSSPIGRLDRWNLTWEWMRGEFIYSMKGAYTPRFDTSDCVYGLAGRYLKGFDFTNVMNCEKKPTITDLPLTKVNDTQIGKIPYCCKNASLLPPQMDPSRARAIFQLRVYKLPPDTPPTILYPPQRWNITGVLNARYHCGPPIRVDPSEFPNLKGFDAKVYAIASWQVVCNMTRPEKRKTRCCVSFSAYYSDGAIPCSTCACGCDNIDTDKCNPDKPAMHLPPDALLLPSENRTAKTKAFAKLKKKGIPKKLPCPDNCGVSINWHINTDHKAGWSARMTLFNWQEAPFVDWFVAVEIKKAYPDYDNVFSFNGTKKLKGIKNTIFFQSLKDLNYLVEMKNGSKPSDPKVPGKQQSVISFTKKKTPNIKIRKGDGFPSKVYFNGEECALPRSFPSSGHRSHLSIASFILISITTTFLLIITRFI